MSGETGESGDEQQRRQWRQILNYGPGKWHSLSKLGERTRRTAAH
ncbi:MAG: hypothetical protein ACTSQZ_07035 [Candidatus Thorarchaeota archaeon]